MDHDSPKPTSLCKHISENVLNIWASSVLGNELLLGSPASKSNLLCTHSWHLLLAPDPGVSLRTRIYLHHWSLNVLNLDVLAGGV